MSKLLPSGPAGASNQPSWQAPLARRTFLQYSSAGLALTGLALSGCNDDDDDDAGAGEVNVGSGDTAILNYAYALEQLEAAFYAQVKTGAYYTGLAATSAERQILDDIAAHEKAHADFFKTALGTSAIKALEPDFSSINFADRTAVLNAAKAFEDLGVAAYNGAGRFIQADAYLVLAGKIVSVEARHAALIRDLIGYNTFVESDVVDLFTPTGSASAPGVGNGTGKEKSKRPTEVVATANNFLKTGSKLNVSGIV